MEREAIVPKPQLVETVLDHLERGHLLAHEEHLFLHRDQCGDDVRDRLALARPRRPLEDEGRPRLGKLHRALLRRIGGEHIHTPGIVEPLAGDARHFRVHTLILQRFRIADIGAHETLGLDQLAMAAEVAVHDIALIIEDIEVALVEHLELLEPVQPLEVLLEPAEVPFRAAAGIGRHLEPELVLQLLTERHIELRPACVRVRHQLEAMMGF